MLQILSWCVCRLPARWADAVGGMLGAVLWHVLRLRRRVAVDNIQQALQLDGAASHRLGRAVYGHLGHLLAEYLRLPLLTPERASEVLGAANLDVLQQLRRERGLLVLTAHIGNWDLLACAAGLAGVPIHVVTRRVRQSAINEYWMASRGAFGVTQLPAQGSAMRIARALQRGEVVAFVLDQHEPGGVSVPFLGRPAATSTSLARIARATGAAVLPAFLVRVDGDYQLRLGTPREVTDVMASTDEFSREIEAVVRDFPEQWFWVHRRWKMPVGPD